MLHMLIWKFWWLSCRTPSGCLCRRRWGWSWWWIWSVVSFMCSLLLQKSSLKVSFAYLKNYYPLQAAPCGCLYDGVVAPPPLFSRISLRGKLITWGFEASRYFLRHISSWQLYLLFRRIKFHRFQVSKWIFQERRKQLITKVNLLLMALRAHAPLQFYLQLNTKHPVKRGKVQILMKPLLTTMSVGANSIHMFYHE